MGGVPNVQRIRLAYVDWEKPAASTSLPLSSRCDVRIELSLEGQTFVARNLNKVSGKWQEAQRTRLS